MPTKHHPRQTHSLAFYLAVIRLLIDGIRAGLTHAKLARLLNDSQLPAPSGANWTATSVKLALYKCKHPDAHPSKIYQAICRLVFVGMLSRDEGQVLTTPRGFEILL
ncbi:hypothetical protein [Cupriavidus sp. SW-Y-13]|uniref:hypothetical protein n=1 Tax=Cupriavidus sp. SW-Y-13 TaxID=2653854 RepID=UPI00136584C2|nr:hypothetical protein [Cupriavidus sp. SW-Y-13]MWL87676.1 hypothetical protein [Cupriavidus sp. SW-Y-13]